MLFEFCWCWDVSELGRACDDCVSDSCSGGDGSDENDVIFEGTEVGPVAGWEYCGALGCLFSKLSIPTSQECETLE